MNKKEKIQFILNHLEKKYKNAKCGLIFEKPYELLIATRLSAQCTDLVVNKVTKKLFLEYKSLKDFANASFEEIKEIIKPCGLFNKKAFDIINICKILVEKFNSNLPCKMEDLLILPGIGRKSANLILGEIFKKPAIVVDTHVKRISIRLELVFENSTIKIEKELKKIIPKKQSLNFCHKMVLFGREICKAKNPLCKNCYFPEICKNIHKNI